MSTVESSPGEFIDAHVRRVQPLMREANLAAWEAATTGREDAILRSAEARTAVKQVYARPEDFRNVRGLRGGEAHQPFVARQLLLLDHAFTANQLPPATIEDLTFREAELERIFYNFRARVDGKELSNNDLRELLASELSSVRRRTIWEASKMIGRLVSGPLLELVRRRNAAARDLGFANYYSMELSLQEIDETELFALLGDFRERSDASFRKLRDRLDADLARRYDVAPAELRPWHWDDFFSQEAPAVGGLDLDPELAPLDHEELARSYFARIGLPVDDVIGRSDLYEREGKDQHAFCMDIDREGDVRMLCNLRPNERWLQTLLHELGHAVYDKFLPRSLPFFLRAPAHILATESIAMYFGRLTRDPEWLRATIGCELSDADEVEVRERQRLAMLVAARWMLVMIHFERALYADPERNDLNGLWWDLVEEYQLIQKPEGRNEPDWATKIHLGLAPVYYHNYLLGEMMASQLTEAMRDAGANTGSVGAFLRDRVFAHGASLHWNDLLRKATGEPLSARHFAEQFIAEPLGAGLE